MTKNPNNDFKFFRYDPSLAAAVIFIVLFLGATLLHAFQMIKTRTWYFIPFVVGGVFEIIGYIGRVICSHQSPNWTIGAFVIQSVFLLVAPALFAASIYMALGRIILLVDGEKHAVIRRTLLTKIFVAGDVFSFLLQAGGGGIQAGGTDKDLSNGKAILVGGLFIQIIFFAIFVATALVFHRRTLASPTARSADPANPWQRHLHVLYAGSVLIFVRSIFRVIEFLQGNAGYILRHEWFLYVFDSVLMLGVMLLFAYVHPSEVNALLKGGRMAKGVKTVELGAPKAHGVRNRGDMEMGSDVSNM